MSGKADARDQGCRGLKGRNPNAEVRKKSEARIPNQEMKSEAQSASREGTIKSQEQDARRSTILEKIVAEKRKEVAALKPGKVSVDELRAALRAREERRDFMAALRTPKSGDISLIAEVKKASPSAGIICAEFEPSRIAKEYEAGGADCVSVLTDEKFFQGSLEYLKQIREAVSIPLLRKDFIIDERQILEAIQWGADAILLIVSILEDAQLSQFHSLAKEAGLAVLVEVHNEAELDRAVGLKPDLLGINNRDLTTFKVDLATTERISARLRANSGKTAASPLVVAESGIHARADVERLAKCGAGAILVGESLMKEGNIRKKIRELKGTFFEEENPS